MTLSPDDRIRSRADYDRVRQSFRWDCPEHFNFGFDVVDHWAETSPDHLALHWVCGEEKEWVSFAAMADRSAPGPGGCRLGTGAATACW